MCYSIESSLKTTTLSLVCIIYLFLSNNPYFKWIAASLVGWCIMQFVEMLLWMTEPQHGCTKWNIIISLTLIPLAVMIQPLGVLFGSFYVTPWSESSTLRKWFSIIFTAFAIGSVSYIHLYKPEKVCTTITPKGHLFWAKIKENDHSDPSYFLQQGLWFLYIMLPYFVFWDKSFIFIILLTITPLFGFLYGHFKTDSRGSIWCFYTSFASIVGAVCLFLKNQGMYNVL